MSITAHGQRQNEGVSEYARGLGYLGSAERIRAQVMRTYGADLGLRYCQSIIDERRNRGTPNAAVSDPSLFCRVCEEALGRRTANGICRECITEERSRLELLKAIEADKTQEPPPVIAPPRITVRWITTVAAKIFGVTVADLVGPSRQRPLTFPRFAICLIAKEQNRWSYPEIGRRLGGRDHSTVINGYRKAAIYARVYPEYAAKIEALRQAVRDAFPQQVAA